MSIGVGQLTQMDPLTKMEFWLFQKVGQIFAGRGFPGANGDGMIPIYQRLSYNLVRYDGDVAEYIEPANMSDFIRIFGDLDANRVQGDPVHPMTDGANRMCGARYYDKRPFEVFSYNDVDVANNVGALT